MMKTRTVYVDTCLPASIDVVWERLLRLCTLRYIAWPYATFVPVGNAAPAWAQGNTYQFRLKLFGIISLGIHTIRMERLDEASRVIVTRESNRFVPVWNHRIAVREAVHGQTCHYSDEVEIVAGWKTPLVAVWCSLFYRHRQRKWLRLLA